MHPSRLRLGPSQSRPLTDASPGSARSPGLRVCRGAPSRRQNIHTHAPFRTERQSFLRCRDVRLTISRNQRSAHAAALRRQRPQVRILSGAPIISICYVKALGRPERFGYHMATETMRARRSNSPLRPGALRPFTGPGWRPPRQASLGDAAPLLARAASNSRGWPQLADPALSLTAPCFSRSRGRESR